MTNELQKIKNKNLNILKEQQRLGNKVSLINDLNLNKKYDIENFDTNYYRPLTTKLKKENKYKQRKNIVLSYSIRDKAQKFKRNYKNFDFGKNIMGNISMNNNNYNKKQDILFSTNNFSQNKVGKQRIGQAKNDISYLKQVVSKKKDNFN